MLKVMIDSTTFLSGLFFEGNENKVLMLKIEGKIQLVVSEYVRDESRVAIFRREEFYKHPNFDDVFQFFSILVKSAELVTYDELRTKMDVAGPFLVNRGKKDIPVLASALFTNPDYLITGDDALLSLKGTLPFKVVTTREFLDEFLSRAI